MMDGVWKECYDFSGGGIDTSVIWLVWLSWLAAAGYGWLLYGIMALWHEKFMDMHLKTGSQASR